MTTGAALADTFTQTYYADGADHTMNVYLQSSGTHTFAVDGVPWGTYNYVGYRDSGSGYTQVYSDSTTTGWDPSFSTSVAAGYKVKLVVYDGNWNVKSVYYWIVTKLATSFNSCSASPNPADLENTITLNAYGLNYTGGSGLGGVTVKFYVDNVLKGSATTSGTLGSRGDASISVNAVDIGSGSHTLKVVYEGDSYYNSCQITSTFTINPKKATSFTSCSASPNPADLENSITLDAKGLNYTGGSGLGGVTVKFYVDNVLKGSATTSGTLGSRGDASISVNAVDIGSGSHTLKVAFEGNAYYSSCEKTATFTVNPKKATSFTSCSASPNPVDLENSITLDAKGLNYTGGSGLGGVTVKFYVDNVLKGSATTSGTLGSRGDASISVNAVDIGSGGHTLKVAFEGDSYYSSCEKTSAFTINPKKATSFSSASVVPSPAEVTDTLTLNAKGLNYTGGNGIGGATVRFYVDNVLKGQGTTSGTLGSRGDCAISLAAQDIGPGSHTLKVVFDGDGYYNGCQTTASFTVNTPPVGLSGTTPPDLTDKNYLPSLMTDRCDDWDGDGTKDAGWTMNKSRCFAPGDTILVHSTVKNNGASVRQTRVTAYYNTTLSTSGLTSIGSKTYDLAGSAQRRFVVPWTAPAANHYYVYVKVEVNSAGTWTQTDAAWVDGGVAAGYVSVSGNKPVILVHGWNGSRESFANLELMLEQTMERPVRSFEYDTTSMLLGIPIDPAGDYPRIDRNGGGKTNLAAQLKTFLSNVDGTGKSYTSVDAVCHSMGGLVARNYCLQEQKIGKLVIIGTPNYGGNFADTLAGDVLLCNQAHDLEYGCSVSWNLFDGWQRNAAQMPSTLGIAGTDNLEWGNYNDSDQIVLCSSASMENLGFPIYYVPGSHVDFSYVAYLSALGLLKWEFFGFLAFAGLNNPIAGVDDNTHTSWAPIQKFLSGTAYPFTGLPGNNGGADDVGHKDNTHALKTGAFNVLAKNGNDVLEIGGSVASLLEFSGGVWRFIPWGSDTGINTSDWDANGDNESVWWYINGKADENATGTRYYKDYKVVLNYPSVGAITNDIRVFAGETAVSVFDFTDTPQTPTPLLPADEAVITTLTPTLSWSAFSSTVPGRTQAGYQVRVRCDTDGDTIIYDQYVSATSGSSHQIPAGTLAVNKHYHWHVRYKDNANAWSAWSADNPNPHQDFYTVQTGSFVIYSDHGNPNPSAGSYTWTSGQTMPGGSVSSPANQVGGSRYRCTGYTGTGNAPSGSGTSYAGFTITQDSTLRWNWKAQYQVTPTAGANGTINPTSSAWYDTGANVAFTASPATGFAVDKWFVNGVAAQNGGTNCTLSNVQEPKTVEVTFQSTTPANLSPVITEGEAASVVMSKNGAPTPFALTLHATDANADSINWRIQTYPQHGSASASGWGNAKAITYQPDTDYVGQDSFVVQVDDGRGLADSITVNVQIQPPTADTVKPAIQITSPTPNPTYTSQTNLLNIAGTATDNVSIAKVDVRNSRDVGGYMCAGTTNWQFNGLPLYQGTNTITAVATDSSGNSATDTLTVTYNGDVFYDGELRSGAMLQQIDFPDNLTPGSTVPVRWKLLSYVPVRSCLDTGEGTPTGWMLIKNGTFQGVEDSPWNISLASAGKKYASLYSFESDWTVPNHPGDFKAWFNVSQQDGKQYMIATIPEGVDNRPDPSSSKVILRTILTGGTDANPQTETRLTDPQQQFDTLNDVKKRSGGTIIGLNMPDNLVVGTQTTCQWKVMAYMDIDAEAYFVDMAGQAMLLEVAGTRTAETNSNYHFSFGGVTYNAKEYTYQATFTVPNATGVKQVYFRHRLRGDSGSIWMSGNIAPGVDSRPYLYNGMYGRFIERTINP